MTARDLLQPHRLYCYYYRVLQVSSEAPSAWLSVLRPNAWPECLLPGGVQESVSLWNSGYAEAPAYRKMVLSPFVASIYIYIYFFFFYLWLCWVFVSVRGLSLVAASGGHSSSRCAGLSLSRPLLLRSTGSRRAGSVVVTHGPSCSVARGIFPDQGPNPCPLHWQADSQPLRHQGSPLASIFLSPFSIMKNNA